MAEREHFTNGRCFSFGGGMTLMGTAFGAQITNWPHWISIGAAYGTGMVLISGSIILIAKSYFSKRTGRSSIQDAQRSGITPGIPSVSALLGVDTKVDFDAKKFLAHAYYSPVTAEVEKNIKAIAQEFSPNDKEAFYARFIGVGAVSFQHEYTWLLIFGSQLRALLEMSSRGFVPSSDLKKHYDKAAANNPKLYEDYSFEGWLNFLKNRLLIVVHPSEMVELTFNGQDFLKYLTHIGRNAEGQPN